jgi:hypothetical protein
VQRIRQTAGEIRDDLLPNSKRFVCRQLGEPAVLDGYVSEGVGRSDGAVALRSEENGVGQDTGARHALEGKGLSAHGFVRHALLKSACRLAAECRASAGVHSCLLRSSTSGHALECLVQVAPRQAIVWLRRRIKRDVGSSAFTKAATS